jgi:uncharacterized protein
MFSALEESHVAGSSFFALLDDIASVLDDVAAMTKVATKKTAGVLGDDLALNAEQVTGVRPDRELAVVWAVAKGSARNKLILVPIALLLSQFLPIAVTVLLMFGGGFLCYEGAAKLAHKFLTSKDQQKAAKVAHANAVANPAIDLVAVEDAKIKGAVRTDFVLSAELIVISLSTMTQATFTTRVATLVAVSAIMTVGIYGLVAGIVKLDDAGIALSKKGAAARMLGRTLIVGAPILMRFLSIAGTAAMFLVGGGILTHGVPPLSQFIADLATRAGSAGWLVSLAGDGLAGLIAGAVLVAVITPIMKRVRRAPTAPTVGT